MKFRWGSSNKVLLAVVASAVTLDGVLTALVVHQQHVQRAVNGQVDLDTAVPLPALRGPVPASAVPQVTPAPPVATTPFIPGLVTSTPRMMTPPRQAKRMSPRRVDPVTASPPPPQTNPSNAAVKPGAPPEVSNPRNSVRADTAVKPGAPPQSS
jgi:hypothetical protein